MTSRQVFEAALIELNKVQAPSLILEDYNYFINKAVSQYINKMYNLYDVNQQKTDDLRVLKSSTVLTPSVNNDYGTSALFSKTYEVNLPDDYLHILNCVCEYTLSKSFKCYNSGDTVHFGAKRLTGDMWSQIINNYYMRPQYKNPYFYINNVNIVNTFPTTDNQIAVTNTNYTDISNVSAPLTLLGYYKVDIYGKQCNYYYYTDTEIPKITITNTFTVGGQSQSLTTPTTITRNSGSFVTDGVEVGNLINTGTLGPGPITAKVLAVSESTITLDLYNDEMSNGTTSIYLYKIQEISSEFVEKIAESRYGNKSKVRLEIRYGKDNSVFALSKVYVDYIKTPQYIRLTQDQIDEVEDTSQLLEFPDYVCQEIVNELVKLLMENASDPRLQTNIPINQTIANPGQQDQKR